jgi:serine/threonine protein kinase
MELLEGETLGQMVARRGPLPVAEVASVVSQAASALDYAHGQGVVHRDIKPGNIIVDKGGHATLTDFGIARAMEGTRLTSAGAILGTPEYMSPEQAQGREADRRSDIYSLGVVCYEMLTGRAPFHAETPLATLHQQAYEPPPEPRKLNPNLSLAVERVLLKALAKEPRERYGSAGELTHALEAAAARRVVVEPPTVAVTTPKLAPVPRPKRVWPVHPAVVAGALVAMVVLSGVILGGFFTQPPAEQSVRVGPVRYVVKPGETRELLAASFGLSPEAISPQAIQSGQTLVISPPAQYGYYVSGLVKSVAIAPRSMKWSVRSKAKECPQSIPERLQSRATL